MKKLLNCNLLPYPNFYIKIGGWWMVQNDAWVDSYNHLSYSMRTLYQVFKLSGCPFGMPSGCLRVQSSHSYIISYFKTETRCSTQIIPHRNINFHILKKYPQWRILIADIDDYTVDVCNSLLHYPPKLSYMMLSDSTPRESSIATTAFDMGPGPHM